MGALVVCLTLSDLISSNLAMLLQAVPILKGMQPIIRRVDRLGQQTRPADGGTKRPTFEKSVQVRGLSFCYQEGVPVITGGELELASGGKYALIGESGCGKSTLINLIAGRHSGYEGEIRYDGTELRELDHGALNGIMAIIHQNVYLFNDSIRNNICLYEEFDEAAFQRAIQRSGVKKFLDGLPEGADYMVGERGCRLSGGQRQRIAIARALIRNASFLIIDEGTSSLDEQNAAEIEQELLGMEELTLLTITHHLKNEERYDAVLEMEHGSIRCRAADCR